MIDLNAEVKKKVEEREEHWMNVNLAKGEIWNDHVQLKDIVLSILMSSKNKREAWIAVNDAYQQLSSPAKEDTYGKVLKQTAHELVDGELVLSGWESEDAEPKAPKEPQKRPLPNFQLIPYVKNKIRLQEMEFYKANDAETEEAMEMIMNPMMSDLITNEDFLEDAVKDYIKSDIGFKFDSGDTYILGKVREDLKEEINSEECWECLAVIIEKFI